MGEKRGKEEKRIYGPYTEEVIKHFRNPHNMGRMENPDSVGRVGNPLCGDVLYVYIKIDRKQNDELFLKDVKFESFGCAAAIATGSMTTDLAKGKTLEQALKITKNDIADSLGGLPLVKRHCSMLASDALHEAIFQYYKKNNLPISKELEKTHERIIRETGIAEEIREKALR